MQILIVPFKGSNVYCFLKIKKSKENKKGMRGMHMSV